jgi:hypothetical protein
MLRLVERTVTINIGVTTSRNHLLSCRDSLTPARATMAPTSEAIRLLVETSELTNSPQAKPPTKAPITPA